MSIPNELKYTAEHEWLRIEGDIATVGVTAFAADALGDVVYLELPPVESKLTAGQPCGEIESTKSVSDLYAPADGEVLEINQAVVDDPSLLNTDPFRAGWLLRIKVANTQNLMDADAYRALTEGR